MLTGEMVKTMAVQPIILALANPEPEILPEVAQDSGVAARPITDLAAYRDTLSQMIYRTGFFMKPVFTKARASPRRVAFAEALDVRVLRAVQTVVDEGIAKPVLIGDKDAIGRAIRDAGLRLPRCRKRSAPSTTSTAALPAAPSRYTS